MDRRISTEGPDVAAIVFCGLVAFGLNADYLLRGDAATYANNVTIGRFDDISLHLGYYGTVFLAQQTFGRLLGIPIHEMLVYLNVVCGALSLGLTYMLARRLIGGRLEAVAASVFMALCGRVTMNATSSEIYMLQTLLVLLSFVLYIDDRPSLAGAAAGAALLVSPLSAFAYLFYPAFELTRGSRPNWRAFGRMLAGGTIVYLPYLLLMWRELFFGRRGLITIDSGIPLTFEPLYRNFPAFQFKHYTALLLLLIPAMFEIKRSRRFAILTAATLLPHLYIVITLPLEDNTFLLPTDAFFACWLALGVRRLLTLPYGYVLAAAPPLAHLALLLISGALPQRDSHRGYAAEMRDIAKRHLVGKNAVLISDWDVGIVITYFGRDAAAAIIESEPLYRQVYDIRAKASVPQPSLDGPQLLLIDPWEPGALNKLFRSPQYIAQLKADNSIVALAERTLRVKCTESERFTHILYSCIRLPAAADAAGPG